MDEFTYGEGDNGAITIHFKAGPYTGVTFAYGKVWFPDESKPILSFEYDLLAGEQLIADKDQFNEYIGRMLEELLRAAMEEETLIYTGGTNESGNANSVKPANERNIFS